MGRIAFWACLVALCSSALARAQAPPIAPPIAPLQPSPTPPSTALPMPSRQNQAPATHPDIYLPAGDAVNLPLARKQTLRFSPRYGNPGSFDMQTVEPGLQRLTYIGGLIINVTYEVDTPKGPKLEEYEFAADNLVIWIRGLRGADILGGVTVAPPPPGGEKTRIELFLCGNVIVRNKDEVVGTTGVQVVTRTIRADQVYYDVDASKAIALKADLEMKFDRLTDAVHIYGDRVERLGTTEWRAYEAGLFSSKLPSDPSLVLRTKSATLTEQQTVRTNIFGIPYRTLAGEELVTNERILTARNTRVDLAGLPIFYTPYYRGDIAEPLGPLVGIGAGNDRMFGAQVLTTLDLFKLFAINSPPGHKWVGHFDYLSERGFGLGSEYKYSSPDFLGFGGPSRGQLLAYGIDDKGQDLLAGPRGLEPAQPRTRFRGLWRNQTEWFADRDADGIFCDRYLTLQTGFAYLTDKNFLEQYYKQEFDHGPNQETFAFLSGSRGQFYGSALVQGGFTRQWITETQWLPNVTGAVVGQSFLDNYLQYEARLGAGYARLLPSQQPPLPYRPTDARVDAGRFDLFQELSVPFDLGPIRFNPYGVLDLADYTRDLNGDNRGRIYGGGGVRSSTTISRLYRDASSELFNVHGLNHKATFWSNYYYAQSNVPHTQLPQFDRLNDDALDQAMRTIYPFYTQFLPGVNGVALQNGAQFDPQNYAVRRLVLNRIDTRDDIHVVQTGLFQRLQTKRGLPGNEHTVDWMSLDLTASFFPQSTRDNFGKTAAFLDFNYIWNLGDQTALTASGWFDPYDPAAANYWTIGSYLNRPDGVSFFAGYRQTDPLNSKAVTLAVSYELSKKYSFSMSSSYDFGNQLALSNSFTIFRTGTDLTVGLGFSYNSLINNFGVQFVIVPNVASALGIGRLGNTVLAAR